VLLIDLYLKYIIVGRNLKLLFKHHWLDISMTALIPITSKVRKDYPKDIQSS
jgi:hypothetical protein